MAFLFCLLLIYVGACFQVLFDAKARRCLDFLLHFVLCTFYQAFMIIVFVSRNNIRGDEYRGIDVKV